MSVNQDSDTAVTRENIRLIQYLTLMKLRRFDEAAIYAEPDPTVIAEIVATRGLAEAARLHARAVRGERFVKRGLRIRRFLPFLR